MSARLRFRVRQLVHDLTGGLLFRPALIAAGLALAALLLIELESEGALARWEGGGWFFREDPSSSLAVLGAIAGSMMAVISIVYSVLLVALSLASVQFSPRILGGFVRDPVSQRTLGLFLGTFVYCLLVMRATRTDPVWVPVWAVALGCVLGLTCLIFLIYFLHHIATSIQVNHLVDRVATQSEAVIADVYPFDPGPPAPPRPADAIAVEADRAGYLQLVDHDGLVELARDADAVIHLAVVPGDYITRGRTLAWIARGGRAITPRLVIACREGFDVGPIRTMQQDVAFGLRQLVDIALKAISPAINDPSTAGTCIDRLGSLVGEIAVRQPGDRVLAAGGVPRLVIPQPDLDELVDLAFTQLRQYGRSDLAVSIKLLGALLAAGRPATPAQRVRILAHLELVRVGVAPGFLPDDRARFDAQHAAVAAALA